MSRKFPKIPVSKNVLTNILYVITLALAVNYIMKKQISALLSLFLIAGLVYYFKKNVTLSLIVSIIATNLLIAMNYLVGPKFEQFKSNQDMAVMGSKTNEPMEANKAVKAKEAKPEQATTAPTN
jgi:uncharacterized membrane protein (UPF0136 family)